MNCILGVPGGSDCVIQVRTVVPEIQYHKSYE